MKTIGKYRNPGSGHTGILLLVFFLAFPSACEKEEQDDPIKVAEGDPFTIELRANWSTGYHWEWTNRDQITIADTTHLEYITDDPGVGGTSGTEIWSFEAGRIGEEILLFEYRPPGSTGSGVEETREFTLIVH
jgi:predicted secreted protein